MSTNTPQQQSRSFGGASRIFRVLFWIHQVLFGLPSVLLFFEVINIARDNPNPLLVTTTGFGLTSRPAAKTSTGSQRILLIPEVDAPYYVWRRGRLRQLRQGSRTIGMARSGRTPGGPALQQRPFARVPGEGGRRDERRTCL
jgi:hypothetical protein